MRIGILSDSHGAAAMTRRAVSALRQRGARHLLHLGDIGSEAVIEELLGGPASIVFGNCDDDLPSMTRLAVALGIDVQHPMGMLTVGSARVAFTHGHLEGPLQQAMRDGVEFLLHGHSHEPRDERIGPTRVINPGALHRAARYTAAVLDPEADTVEFVVIATP